MYPGNVNLCSLMGKFIVHELLSINETKITNCSNQEIVEKFALKLVFFNIAIYQ